MKKIISMLTAAALCSGLAAGCGTQQEETENPEASALEIQISTIQIETQNLTSAPPAETSVPETETIPLTEAAGVLPTELMPAKLPAATETAAPESGTALAYQYNNIDFDKAVFAALLDGIYAGTSGGNAAECFFVSDPDKDGDSELLTAFPYTSTSSQNIVLENMASAGVYYYDATGVDNDFYVLDAVTGNIYLNENTRSETGEDIISREYFEWTGSKWQSACMLYRNKCYWNYENVSADQFLRNAEAANRIASDDIFNLTIPGTPETAAEAFYQYLVKTFKLERAVAADIDGDGFTEQVLFVQNLSQRWCANVRNLYQEEGDVETFSIDPLQNMHTTCFVIDSVGTGRIRIRSESFDRRYRFAQSGGKLFAYDDTNTIQAVQYSTENDGFGKHFMTVATMS